LLGKITTKYADPYTQDSGYELLRMGERRSSLGQLLFSIAAQALALITDEEKPPSVFRRGECLWPSRVLPEHESLTRTR
jgi:hypothetical protein